MIKLQEGEEITILPPKRTKENQELIDQWQEIIRSRQQAAIEKYNKIVVSNIIPGFKLEMIRKEIYEDPMIKLALQQIEGLVSFDKPIFLITRDKQ